MFGKIMTKVVTRADQGLDLVIAEIERAFAMALGFERQGNPVLAEQWLDRAIKLEAQAI